MHVMNIIIIHCQLGYQSTKSLGNQTDQKIPKAHHTEHSRSLEKTNNKQKTKDFRHYGGLLASLSLSRDVLVPAATSLDFHGIPYLARIIMSMRGHIPEFSR